MGRIYAPPKEVGPDPSITLDIKEYDKQWKVWENKLREWCRENADRKNAIVGEIVRHPVADGYAYYMILSLRPVKLIHLPYLDGYQFSMADRWRAEDLKQMVTQERALQKLFGPR